jgi:hypothetical protein
MLKLGKGTVLFVVLPFADVSVGKKPLGQTPLPPQEMYEGTYEVSFSNPSLQKTEVKQVKVTAGKETTVKINLQR